MINFKISCIATAIIFSLSIAACKTKKSTNTSTVTTTSNPTNTGPSSVGPLIIVKSKEGINPPGEEELVAIQNKYPFETLPKLNQGYELYAKTVCVDCHSAKSIYSMDLASWRDVINDMAGRAKLSEQETDAVYKYVLAIKATQP